MIAKIVVFLCAAFTAQAGYIGGHGYSSLGYSGLGYHGLGYSGVVPYSAYSAYSAPVVAKAVIPAVYSPAVSHVSRYDVHSSPIVKSYVAPVTYGGVYGGYGGYGYGGYGYGGLGGKYLW